MFPLVNMSSHAMVKYIDAHTHLCAKDFNEDFEDVIQRAKDSDIAAVLVLSEHAGEVERIMQLADKYPGFCLPCLGVHPVQTTEDGKFRCVTEQDLEDMIPHIEKYHDKLVAIGEVGLDFSPMICSTYKEKDTQRKVLRRQVELSKRYGLPLNVHSRSAGRPTIKLLEEEGAKNVLLHAFDGKPSVALQGVKLGYYFSIPPSIIRSTQKNMLVKKLPMDHLLLETDSPALGPVKEVRNEPKNILVSCQHVAIIKNMLIESVASVAFENTLKLFPRINEYLNN